MKILNKKDLLVRANGLAYKKYAKGPFTGTAVSFHNNSQLKSRQSYKYGLPNGSYEVYFENGKLREKGEYSLIWDPYIGVVWYESWEGVQETRENGYLIYTINPFGGVDVSIYEIFKDGKPFDCFAAERQNSEYYVGRYKGHWEGEPVPEFIRDEEIRHCTVRKKYGLKNIREGVWESFAFGDSSFDNNKHGGEIWHELVCFSLRPRTVYSRDFFKDNQVYRSESFFNKNGGWRVHHQKKDGESDLIEEFDAAGNLINSRKFKSIFS